MYSIVITFSMLTYTRVKVQSAFPGMLLQCAVVCLFPVFRCTCAFSSTAFSALHFCATNSSLVFLPCTFDCPALLHFLLPLLCLFHSGFVSKQHKLGSQNLCRRPESAKFIHLEQFAQAVVLNERGVGPLRIRYDTIRYIICTEKLTGKLPV